MYKNKNTSAKKNRLWLAAALVFLLLCTAPFAHAQDIEQGIKNLKDITKQDPLSLTGSINASSVFYDVKGIAPRRDPFYWVVNANLTFNLFNKISVPFSATITQQDKNYSNGLDKFSQPFNQFGLSPKYKWLTVHAGYRTMNFSEYTYAGTMFLGGGFEIKPKKGIVSGSGFFGRLVKAVPVGGVDGVVVSLPAYGRLGGGGKLTVGKETNLIDLVYFKARDNKYSIPFDTSITATPSENQVIGISTKQKLNKLIALEGDFSYSMYTDNLFQERTPVEGFTYLNQIYAPRPSSSFNKAITAAINFTPDKFKFGFKYKRIDPDYRTMGAIFLANDVEEYSANTSVALLKNKLTISASTGFQRNNLDKIQNNTSQRIIGSLNTSYNINEHLSLGANYSNFSSNTIPIRVGVSDTIKLVQLTQSGGFNSSYSFGKKDAKQSLSFNATYQQAGGNQQAPSNNLTAALNYSLVFAKSGFNIAAGGMFNQSDASNILVQSYGPTLALSKSLLKRKIKLTATSNYQVSNSNSTNLFNNMVIMGSFSYAISKHLNFKMDYNFLNRKSNVVNSPGFTENRLNISLSSNFSASSKKVFKRKGKEKGAATK